MRFLEEDDVRAMRKEGDFLKWLKAEMREGQAKADARRALVLKYPDLAQKLTEQPINCQRPEQWSGGIPPEMWREMPNDSPIRPAVLAILAEAERRDRAEQASRLSVVPPQA